MRKIIFFLTVVLSIYFQGISQPDTSAQNSSGTQNQEITIVTNLSSDSSNTVQKSDSVIQGNVYPMPYFYPGDAIKITVYPDSGLFLNNFYIIDQNGYVDLPVLGLVSIKSKTHDEFIDFLKKQYSDYLRYPNINVASYVRVSLFGGFSKPGMYWIEPRYSVWEAIQYAGGIEREDGLKKVRWERDGLIVSNNIIKDFQSGTSLAAMGFKSGDQICVTPRPKMRFWEAFRQDVIPIISFSFTAMSTAFTAYQAYRIVKHD